MEDGEDGVNGISMIEAYQERYPNIISDIGKSFMTALKPRLILTHHIGSTFPPARAIGGADLSTRNNHTLLN